MDKQVGAKVAEEAAAMEQLWSCQNSVVVPSISATFIISLCMFNFAFTVEFARFSFTFSRFKFMIHFLCCLR